MIREACGNGEKDYLAALLDAHISGFVNQPLHPQTADSTPPEAGVVLTMSLPIPEKPEEQQYLGLGGKGTFTIHGNPGRCRDSRNFQYVLSVLPKGSSQCEGALRHDRSERGPENRIKIIASGSVIPRLKSTPTRTPRQAFPHFADRTS